MAVAYGYEKISSWIKKSHLTAAEGIGLLAFIITAILGMAHAFFYNFLANSGLLFGDPVPYGPNPGYLNTAGILPVLNLAVGIEVLGGLGAIILYMMGHGREVRG
jgi:multicomponent Na+:H+ antiporter subunit B